MSDRTVHGTTADDREIVRYDHIGKWYLEAPGARMVACEQVSVRRAAIEAARGKAFLGRPGGRAFDAAYRREVIDQPCGNSRLHLGGDVPSMRDAWAAVAVAWNLGHMAGSNGLDWDNPYLRDTTAAQKLIEAVRASSEQETGR